MKCSKSGTYVTNRRKRFQAASHDGLIWETAFSDLVRRFTPKTRAWRVLTLSNPVLYSISRFKHTWAISRWRQFFFGQTCIYLGDPLIFLGNRSCRENYSGKRRGAPERNTEAQKSDFYRPNNKYKRLLRGKAPRISALLFTATKRLTLHHPLQYANCYFKEHPSDLSYDKRYRAVVRCSNLGASRLSAPGRHFHQ